MPSDEPRAELFHDFQSIRLRTVCVGIDIDTRALRKTRCLSANPLTLEAGRSGCAVVFRYGAVVFFEVDPMDEARFLEGLAPHVKNPAAEPIIEEIELTTAVRGSDGTDSSTISVPSFDLPVLQVTAEVLARSVVLERFEHRVSAAFEALQPTAAGLGALHITGASYRSLLKHLGNVLLDQQEMVGRIAVSDKPDVLWDRPDLERLFARLTDEFEILDRFEAVESKLKLIAHTVQTTIDLIQARRSLRVEWYIVILIIAEIGLTLYEMFIRGH